MTRPAIPAPVLARWRADARRVVTDPSSTESLRRLAWSFLKQWRFS